MSKLTIAQANRIIYAIQQAENFINCAQAVLTLGSYDSKWPSDETLTAREVIEGETGHLCSATNLLTGSGDLNMQNVATHSLKASSGCKHLVRS